MKNVLSDKVRGYYRKVFRHPLVVQLRQRYPRFFHVLAGRFRTTAFTGLPLTLLVCVFLFNSFLLSELTEVIIESGGVVKLDEKFTSMLFDIRSVWLSQLLYFVTQLGSRAAVFVIGGILSVVFLFRRRYAAIVAFWLVMAGVGLSVRYGKTFISRERPEAVAYYQVQNFSFPSGHATTSMALFGMVAYFVYRRYHQYLWSKVVAGLAFLLIGVVGFSRIYLGVHYLTDVLAGFMLGALWLLLGISLVEMLSYRKKRGTAGL